MIYTAHVSISNRRYCLKLLIDLSLRRLCAIEHTILTVLLLISNVTECR